MAFIRKQHKESYTCISNDVFKSSLSLKARGMVCTLLSLPDNWEFSENGIQAILENDGQTSIRSALKELEGAGFLKRTRERDENGHMGKSVWIVCDYPRFENQSLVNANLGNRPQLSTKEESTNKENTKEYMEQTPKAPKEKETRHKYGEYSNVLLSDTEYGKLVKEFPNDYKERIERVSSYCASTGKSYKNYLATIRNWARKDREKSKPTYQKPKRNNEIPDYNKDVIYDENGEPDLMAMALNFKK